MNFEGFDLNLLVAFNALMLERNVTKAAAMAGVSQPAMSAALARLRRRFDDPLFIRSAEGLLPSAKAQEIAVPIAEALGQVRNLMNPAREFDPNAKKLSFTLGLTEYPLHVLLPAISRKMSALAPDCILHVRSFTGRDETVALLDAGKIDIAISVLPSKDESRILSIPLISDDFVTLIARDHPAAEQEMDLARFLAMKHILVSPEGNHYGLVDAKLRERDLVRNVSLTLPNMFAVPALLPGSAYVATVLSRVMSSAANQQHIMMFPPPLALPTMHFHLLWHRRTHEIAAHHWLRRLIENVAATLIA